MAMRTRCIEGDGKHKLEKKNYKRPYTCYGCEEQGLGVRHRCDQCSYEFHEACALIDSSRPISCELFSGLEFRFLPTPPIVPGYTLYCNACGNVVKGFVVYGKILHQTQSIAISLHPCCRKLKKSLEIKNVKFTLRNTVEDACMLCHRIQPRDSKIKGWSYRSVCRKYHVHVACVMQMVLAKENNNIYMNKSITNRTSLALTNSGRSLRRNNSGGSNMAKEVFTNSGRSLRRNNSGGSNMAKEGFMNSGRSLRRNNGRGIDKAKDVLTNSGRTLRRNNSGGTDFAKDVFMFIAETILSTFLGDPSTLIASSILHFLLK